MRTLLDKMLRGGIKLVMLTGVAFTVTACYGPPPPERYYDRPDYQTDTQLVEQQVAVETDEVVE